MKISIITRLKNGSTILENLLTSIERDCMPKSDNWKKKQNQCLSGAGTANQSNLKMVLHICKLHLLLVL